MPCCTAIVKRVGTHRAVDVLDESSKASLLCQGTWMDLDFDAQIRSLMWKSVCFQGFSGLSNSVTSTIQIFLYFKLKINIQKKEFLCPFPWSHRARLIVATVFVFVFQLYVDARFISMLLWIRGVQGFFSCLHTFSKLCLFFSKLCTQIQELHTECLASLAQMKHCIQNIINTSQKQTFALILIPVRFLCYIENCVLCFAKRCFMKLKTELTPLP